MSNSESIGRDAANSLVSKWVSMWNGDLDIAGDIIAEDNRVHAAMFDGGDGSAVGGVSGMKDLVAQMRALMSDLTFSVEVGPIVDTDHIVVRWVDAGHYGGGIPGAGAPVGSEVTFHGTDILRIANDQVAEYWLNADTLDLMTQLQVGS
ncbi:MULTISPECIES: ester cyclase [Bacteria]